MATTEGGAAMKRCLSLTLAAITGFAASLRASETVVDSTSYPDLFAPTDAVVNIVHQPIPLLGVAELVVGGSGSGPLGTHWNSQVNGGALLGLLGNIVLASTGAQTKLTGSALQFNLSNTPGALLSELGVGTGLTLNWSATAKFDDAGKELVLVPGGVYDVSFDVDGGSGLLNSVLGVTPSFAVEMLDGGGTSIGYSGGGNLANILGLDFVEIVGAPAGSGRVTARFRAGANVASGAASIRFTGSAILPASLGDTGTNFATVSRLSVVAVDAYTAWVDDNEIDEGLQLPDADPDSDGKPNIQEFALATDPNSGAHDDVDFMIADPDGDGAETSGFVMTLPVRAGAEFTSSGGDQVASQDGANYRVEGSYELQTWTLAVSEVVANQPFKSALPPLPVGWEYRSFRLPDQTQETPRAFLRVVFDE